MLLALDLPVLLLLSVLRVTLIPELLILNNFMLVVILLLEVSGSHGLLSLHKGGYILIEADRKLLNVRRQRWFILSIFLFHIDVEFGTDGLFHVNGGGGLGRELILEDKVRVESLEKGLLHDVLPELHLSFRCGLTVMDHSDRLTRVDHVLIHQNCYRAVAQDSEPISFLFHHNLLVVLAFSHSDVVEKVFLLPGALLVENGVRIGIASEGKQPIKDLGILLAHPVRFSFMDLALMFETPVVLA